MSEWQPMETAPRNGKEILIWVKFESEYGFYDLALWSEEKNKWLTNCICEDSDIKAWFSLPEPPRKKHECKHNYSDISCISIDSDERLWLVKSVYDKQMICSVEYCPFCGEKA